MSELGYIFTGAVFGGMIGIIFGIQMMVIGGLLGACVGKYEYEEEKYRRKQYGM